MKNALTLTCLLSVSVSFATLVKAAEPPTLGHNAALKYWQAFALLPKLDDDQVERLSSSPPPQIDVADRALVAQTNVALDLMQRGANIGPCDWGINREDGWNALLPHLSKARELARLAALRARVRLADDQADGAVADLLAIMRMSRHVGARGSLIEHLVGYAIENIALETAAASLGALPQSARAHLAEGIGDLPPSRPVAEALRHEKQLSLRTIQQMVNSGTVEQQLPALTGKLKAEKVAAAFKDPAAVAATLARLEAAYDRIIEAMGRPYPEAMRQHASFVDEMIRLETNPKDAADVLIAVLMPSVAPIQTAEARMRIRRAMLLSAIAHIDGGPAAAVKVLDPVTGQAFKIAPAQDKPDWLVWSSSLSNAKDFKLAVRTK